MCEEVPVGHGKESQPRIEEGWEDIAPWMIVAFQADTSMWDLFREIPLNHGAKNKAQRSPTLIGGQWLFIPESYVVELQTDQWCELCKINELNDLQKAYLIFAAKQAGIIGNVSVN